MGDVIVVVDDQQTGGALDPRERVEDDEAQACGQVGARDRVERLTGLATDPLERDRVVEHGHPRAAERLAEVVERAEVGVEQQVVRTRGRATRDQRDPMEAPQRGVERGQQILGREPRDPDPERCGGGFHEDRV